MAAGALPHERWRQPQPVPLSDVEFLQRVGIARLEVARAAGVTTVVTQNRRHVASLLRYGATVLTAEEFAAQTADLSPRKPAARGWRAGGRGAPPDRDPNRWRPARRRGARFI